MPSRDHQNESAAVVFDNLLYILPAPKKRLRQQRRPQSEGYLDFINFLETGRDILPVGIVIPGILQTLTQLRPVDNEAIIIYDLAQRIPLSYRTEFLPSLFSSLLLFFLSAIKIDHIESLRHDKNYVNHLARLSLYF